MAIPPSKTNTVTTMVTDERFASYTRFMHDIQSRVLKGSLDPKVVTNALRPLIGQSVKRGHVTVDRSKPFDPVPFSGKNSRIVEQDDRSLALCDINLYDVQFALISDSKVEGDVIGEDELLLLKEAGHIRLDAQILEALLENKDLIPTEWEKEGRVIHFDGTVMRDNLGGDEVICLYWENSKWCWRTRPLHCGRGENYRSAVILVKPEPVVELFPGLSETINLGKPAPRIPLGKGWGIKEHHGGDVVTIEKRSPNDLYIGGKKVVLYRTKREVASGHTLKHELQGQPILNANVFDFLWDNKQFIPEDWKRDRRTISFLGTILNDPDGNLRARTLYFHEGSWHAYERQLDKEWTNSLVALCES